MQFRNIFKAVSWLICAFQALNLSAYQYDFAVCAVFHNEASYLKEWIEYHRLVGAQHFYLYNIGSQDNYLEVLQPYIDSGYVELIDWTDSGLQASGQPKAYMDAIYKTREKAKWLAIINTDEYLVPKTEDTVLGVLQEFEQPGIGGVGVNGQLFGTSFVSNIGPFQLMTEELTRKADEDHEENKNIRSIVRPEYVAEPGYINHFDFKEGYSQVNTNLESFVGPTSPYITIDKMQINHYWTRDENFFYETKVPRHKELGESIESIEKKLSDSNKLEDQSISRFLPPLKQLMFPNQKWEQSNKDVSKKLDMPMSANSKREVLWASLEPANELKANKQIVDSANEISSSQRGLQGDIYNEIDYGDSYFENIKRTLFLLLKLAIFVWIFVISRKRILRRI